MWASLSCMASVIEGLDAAWLLVWFRADDGRWKVNTVFACNENGEFLGEVPRWSIPWNVVMEWEIKAKVGFGRPHP